MALAPNVRRLSCALVLTLLCLLISATAARAGDDIFLALTNSGGVSRTVKVEPGTEVTLDSMPKGAYKLSLLDDQNKVLCDGSVRVQGMVTSPRDPASGLPTGQRMHKPFVFTKQLDKSTPTVGTIIVQHAGSAITIKLALTRTSSGH